jgi:hypothetical protein
MGKLSSEMHWHLPVYTECAYAEDLLNSLTRTQASGVDPHTITRHYETRLLWVLASISQVQHK